MTPVETTTLAALVAGPIQFETPVWLWLIPVGWALTVWIGRRSLSGMATATRRVALVVRLIVLALLAGAMAEPQWRDESKSVDVSVVLDASRSIPRDRQDQAVAYVQDARTLSAKPEDGLNVLTVAVNAYVTSLSTTKGGVVERGFVGSAEGTNLAGGVRLALAVKPQDAAYRVLLVTDGNETVGSLLEAAEAAKAAGVPIDVLPVVYSFDNEIIVDQVVTPATARLGETINVKVVIDATKAARGRLTLLMRGEPIDLDPATEGYAVELAVPAGRSVHSVPVKLDRAVPQEFEAVFEPSGGQDRITENNRALAVTFVAGEGRVLVVGDNPDEYEPLVAALSEAKIGTEIIGPEQFPTSLKDLTAYDAIVLVNRPAYDFSHQTQQDLRQYVHDLGGGLVMVGGDEAFGAGGWIGTPLEDALPIRLDPPQKRQMPRGALALVMHSIEMPDGVHYGMKTAEAAVDALSRLDLAGIVEFDPRAGGAAWVHRMAEVGDTSAIKRSIRNLTFGDMPDFAPSMELALQGLMGEEAGAKHMIMVSDGDPSPPSTKLLQQFKKAKITISTVGVYPHSGMDTRRLQDIAQATGGRHYDVNTAGGLATIHQIFIKEAQTVKRSLIWEGDPFSPAIVPLPIDSMRGITAVPPIKGYVVAADRDGPVFVTLRGKENDPILASWQHGLGRVVTFTSDASTRWASSWVAWGQFRQFWEQHLRWAMRPSGSADARVITEKDGDRTRVIVELTDTTGDRLNFARFDARVALPDGTGKDLELRELGMGRYEGTFDSSLPGSYMVTLGYAAPRPQGTEGEPIKGTVMAAVTRPFADEFRALSDNRPLLEQVAAMTGGRVLSGTPAADDLWRREGLTMPVAATPAWLLFALLGIGMFLADVGVRRVRIDLRAMAQALAGGLRRGKVKAGAQMDALRAAREAAKATMVDRARSTAEPSGAAPPNPLAPSVKATASVKFEASAEQLKRKAAPIVDEAGAPPAPTTMEATPKQETVSKDEGLSRLMKAKRRAQDEMKDE
ncbi:MAG: glutamine amidotransferase [Phycisphaerales bacterium]